MKTYASNLDIFQFPVVNHSDVKGEILRLIGATRSSNLCAQSEMVTNSDWGTPRDASRPYVPLVIKTLYPILENFRAEMSAARWNWENIWFQQYENSGDFHDWHIHSGTMFGVVYYIELPQGAPPTEFYLGGKSFTPDATEGDVIVFPSALFHRSSPNQGAGRKTVVALNINIDALEAIV